MYRIICLSNPLHTYIQTFKGRYIKFLCFKKVLFSLLINRFWNMIETFSLNHTLLKIFLNVIASNHKNKFIAMFVADIASHFFQNVMPF